MSRLFVARRSTRTGQRERVPGDLFDLPHSGVIEQLVAEAGAERILFGSDAPIMDPRSQLGKIITADIDEDAKRMILGMNAQRILGL